MKFSVVVRDLVLDTALLQWISEYAARAYTTADSAVLYLNHAQIA